MAANVGDVGTYLYKSYDATGANREDLQDWIANISPNETPLLNTLGRSKANGVHHQWLTDALRARATRGIGEGLDWESPTHTAPSRVTNVCEIFGENLAVTETQRAENPAGFNDAYAYQVEKATKATMVDIESALMNDGTPSTGTSATNGGRVMKSLEEFITTNVILSTALATAGGATAQAGLMGPIDVNQALNLAWTQGGNVDLIVCGAPYKRQISSFSGAAAGNPTRNILSEAKKLVVAIDVYDSDFGLVPIQLNRWSPVATNTSTATTTASGDVTGRVWFLERAKVRTAWLRPLKHSLMGKRGDSTVGQIRAEMTLEVGNEKACAVIKGANNKYPGVV